MIYVIILSWNNYTDTIECIDSLYRNNGVSFNLVLVDNGSTDGSIEKIVAWICDKWQDGVIVPTAKFNDESNLTTYQITDKETITVIRNTRNCGYSGGNNAGISYALSRENCQYVCLLNNDTLVDKNFLANSLKCFDNPATGIVSPLILYWPDKEIIWYAGGRGLFANVFHFGRGKNLRFTSLKAKEINFANGCAFVAKATLFQLVGLLNEDFFLYGEDLEFSRRALCTHKIIFCPSARVYHKASSSSLGGETFNSNFLYYGRRNIKFLAHNMRQKIGYFLADFILFCLPTMIKILFKGNQRIKLYNSLVRGLIDVWR